MVTKVAQDFEKSIQVVRGICHCDDVRSNPRFQVREL